MAKPYVIGIDMGGTNTAFGIVDARGTVIASSSIKTGTHSKIEDYIDELYTEINRIMVANDAVGKINGIGIGAPNANYFTGVIEDGVNLPWPTPIPLADLITKKFGIPCLITNDANAAAIGEMTYGAARGLNERCGQAFRDKIRRDAGQRHRGRDTHDGRRGRGKGRHRRERKRHDKQRLRLRRQDRGLC